MKILRAQWDRAGAIAAVVIGLVALLIGYIGVSGTEYVVKQMPYIISGGLLGIFLLGLGTAMWLSADLRDEWRELRLLRLHLSEQAQQPLAPAAQLSPPAAVEAPTEVKPARSPRARSARA
jgi:hypothetical protein